MKIAFLNTFAETGGAAVAANRIHDALADKGVSVRGVVQFRENSERDYAFIKGGMFRLAVEKAHFLFFEKNKSIRYKFSTGFTGKDLSDHPFIAEADIIHLHYVNLGFLSLKGLGKLASLGKPVIWTMHDMWPFTGGCHHSQECVNYEQACGNCKYLRFPGSRDLSHRIWKKKNEIFRAGNFHLVGVSQWVARLAEESSLGKHVAVSSIPNPLNVQVFQPKEKGELKEAFSIDKEKLVISFAAFNLDDPRKGFGLFLQAMNRLLVAFPDLKNSVKLLVVGKASQKEKIYSSGLDVCYLGLVSGEENMAKVYQASDLYVTSSLDENFGCTIMEALACGTPVVAFPSGGTPELVRDRETGLLADHGSDESLAEKIGEMIKNDALRTACGERGAKEIDQKYSPSIIADQYIDLYKSVLKA
ncbi:MAG: glycosyltransferase [Cytophagales bacterium]|nr:glycosyltransferase [Cytophagales bacterium]